MRTFQILLILVLVFSAGTLFAQCGSNAGGANAGGCKEGVEAKPAEVPKILQKTCPVMDGAINTEIFAEHEGRKIYFCCKGCIATFNKDPETYIKKVDEQIKKDTAK